MNSATPTEWTEGKKAPNLAARGWTAHVKALATKVSTTAIASAVAVAAALSSGGAAAAAAAAVVGEDEGGGDGASVCGEECVVDLEGKNAPAFPDHPDAEDDAVGSSDDEHEARFP
jgi:hypothetical protein